MLQTYFLFTLGCQMNHSDSERLIAILDSFGLRKSGEIAADLIIVNSCSVRQKPIDRIWGKLKVWSRINPKAVKVLTGCVLPKDLNKLKSRFDFYFKIEDIELFNVWLEKCLSPNKLAKKIKKINYLEMTPKRKNKEIALVPIMSGCDNFCSYCAVPYTRGREWSRNSEDIIKEVRCLVKRGYTNIMLLGQNVNSYKSKKSKLKSQNHNLKLKSDFVLLLEKLVEIPGDFEVSFMSPHPKDFSQALIDLIAKEPKISKEIHLPMQSGDDGILQKMNRGYTAKQYLKLVKKLRSKISAIGGSASGGKNLRLSTDIIVGFPGESEKNFNNTVKMVKSAKFSKAYVSIYSPRTGTIADKKFKDSISAVVKRERWLRLDNFINKSEIRNPNDESNPKSE